MKFKEWRAKRKERKEAKRDPYDREELRLLKMQGETTPLTDEYKEIQAEIDRINKARAESRESKRRITREGKVNLGLKGLGIVGTVASILAIAHIEKDSSIIVTGEKRTILDALCRAAGNFLHK